MKRDGSYPQFALRGKHREDRPTRPSSEFHARGFYVGVFAGTIIGVLLFALGDPKPPLSLGERVWSACMMPIVVGLLGELVDRTMWLLVAGGMIGVMILGLICDMVFRDRSSLLWGIPLGAAIGILFGFQFANRWRSMHDAKREKPQPGSTTGVWDREIDGGV